MATDPLEIGSDLLLVHEGTADLQVLGALMRHVTIQGFQLIELGGQPKMRHFFKALAKSPHFKSPVRGFETPVRAIAVVIDAETDAEATFQSVCDALTAADLPAPSAAGGISDGPLRIGVFLLPDNHSAGKIETLCLRSVADDPAWSCVGLFFDCVKERTGKLPANLDKAHAQAFLSTRPEPDLPVGLAALEGYWRWESPVFAPLIGFLKAISI
jgi:hypothetical protein